MRTVLPLLSAALLAASCADTVPAPAPPPPPPPASAPPPPASALVPAASVTATVAAAPPPAPEGPPGKLNVLLLTIDSLRADMPWNGYGRDIAPALTAF